MLSFLPAPILFCINLTFVCCISLLLATPVLFLAIFKALLPLKFCQKALDIAILGIYRAWVYVIAGAMKVTTNIQWDIQGREELEPIKGSCIIISNHISWTDIVMLGHIYRGKIPLTKFFLKQSLIFIPIIGQVCYALGMPFLKRYSRNELLKNPALKNKDIEATKKACLNLLESRSALVNFVEGTRHSEEKAKRLKSPYQNLMPPKATSFAIALSMIGEHIDCVLNTTILYPKNQGNIFLALLCGRLHQVVARIEVISKEEIKEKLIGDYLNDKQYKRTFALHLRDIWIKKDQQIASILQKDYTSPIYTQVSEQQAKAKQQEQEQKQTPTEEQTYVQEQAHVQEQTQDQKLTQEDSIQSQQNKSSCCKKDTPSLEKVK